MADLAITPLTPADLPDALRIQSQIYPAFLVEDEASFRSRIDLAASYCLAARRGDELLGYLLAHGWPAGSPPPVGTCLTDGSPAEILFIHDLAVSPAARGLKVGERLIDHAFARAARSGLTHAELIAVEGAASYWARLGFSEPETVPEALRNKVAGYGAQARWMTRAIPPAA